eukprot:scaffold11240_cov137-Skeletonema_dohrnii-CCMP3373.AAC.2
MLLHAAQLYYHRHCSSQAKPLTELNTSIQEQRCALYLCNQQSTGGKKLLPGKNCCLGKTLTNYTQNGMLLAFDRAAGGRHRYDFGAVAAASGSIFPMRHP